MQKLYYKITAIILAAFIILCFTPSCMANPDDSNSYKSSGDTLTDILANYRNDGMTSWWQIVAVYNAGENPMDYKGFDDILGSIIGDDNTVMASYVIVSDIAAVIGADPGYFEKYEEYKTKLKNLLENPLDSNTLNDYIFSYYALKCSGMIFDETSFLNYLSQAQKSDGGFALSGDAGDIDITAFVVPALKLLSSNADPVSSINPAIPLMQNAVKFLENNVGDDGACASVSANATENSNSTAVALSALVGYYNDDGSANENIKKVIGGLDIFKLTTVAGYSYLKDGLSANVLSTSQAAIALGDLKDKTSVWQKLYSDSVTAFANNPNSAGSASD